jgi:hypothetical protein
MNIFPDNIKIIIINKDNEEPIPNIAVSIKLFATSKNDYGFILPFSNYHGIININKEWLLNKIKEERDFFVMDYSSNLDDCQPRFKLDVLDSDAIQRALKAQKLYKPYFGFTQETIDALLKVDNSKFTPVSEIIELIGDKNVEIILSLAEIQ